MGFFFFVLKLKQFHALLCFAPEIGRRSALKNHQFQPNVGRRFFELLFQSNGAGQLIFRWKENEQFHAYRIKPLSKIGFNGASSYKNEYLQRYAGKKTKIHKCIPLSCVPAKGFLNRRIFARKSYWKKKRAGLPIFSFKKEIIICMMVMDGK